ncbi:MAG: hypothetical protein HY866_06775 [Chloroflexi bacterium]|nr:hypothetical protein [Chloroflexota bacterium]
MTKWLKKLTITLIAAVMAFGVVGMASAQGPDDTRPRGPLGGPERRLLGSIMDAVTAAGLESDALIAQMRDEDLTLAEALEANGVDPQPIVDAVKAELTAEIAQAVTDGKITQERADALTARLDDALDRAMNTALRTPLRDRVEGRVDDSLIGVLAEMAGVDAAELVRDALTPPTLAEIAASYGLDANAVIAEAEARITEDINQAVADGKIMQERADEALANLHDNLTERFNNPLRSIRQGMRGGAGPLRGGFGGQTY